MISIHPKHSFDLNSFRVATKVIRFTEISDLLSTVNIFKTCENFFLWYWNELRVNSLYFYNSVKFIFNLFPIGGISGFLSFSFAKTESSKF